MHLKNIIHDTHPAGERQVELAVIPNHQSLIIEAAGHGVCNMDDSSELGKGHRPVVALEIWDGELRVIVWSDINEEDPTHIIPLTDAQTNKRQEGSGCDGYKQFVITLKQLVPDDELGFDDEHDIGKLGLNGTRQFERTASSETRALDDFHAVFPIGCLEDYEITIQEKVLGHS